MCLQVSQKGATKWGEMMESDEDAENDWHEQYEEREE
jgi:hypothetical protein